MRTRCWLGEGMWGDLPWQVGGGSEGQGTLGGGRAERLRTDRCWPPQKSTLGSSAHSKAGPGSLGHCRPSLHDLEGVKGGESEAAIGGMQ